MFLFVSACATIVGDKQQLLGIQSSPDQAQIVITDEKGTEVFKGQTPTTVTLDKSDGSYFGGKTYTVKIMKDGYESESVRVDSRVNGWYIAGNFVFGGLIGWFIVDPLTGAMYNLSPEQVSTSLHSKSAQNEMNKNSINIVLLKDVPEELRAKMVRIN